MTVLLPQSLQKKKKKKEEDQHTASQAPYSSFLEPTVELEHHISHLHLQMSLAITYAGPSTIVVHL